MKTRKGDGERLLRCWRYLLPICKSADRRNFAIEVIKMLCQYEFELPPQQAQELIWSRFISTHASPGHNIPEDLHQEHLNRVIKDAIRDLGANKTEVAKVRAGKALGTLDPVLRKFDAERNHQVTTSLQVQLKILRSSLSNCSKQIFLQKKYFPMHDCMPLFPYPKTFYIHWTINSQTG